MIVNTSDNSEPARINFRMLRTDSLEKRADSFCARSSFGRSCAADCIADLADLRKFKRSPPVPDSGSPSRRPPGNTARKNLFLGYTHGWVTRSAFSDQTK